MSPPRRSARVWTWVRPLATIAIVAAIVVWVDFSRFTLVLDGSAALALAGSVVLITIGLGLSALRWKVLFGPSLRFATALRLYFVAWFWSLFLPTSVGGDAVRALGLSRAGHAWGATVTSVLVDRGLGVAALGLFILVGVSLTVTHPEPVVPPIELGAPPEVLWGLVGIAVLALVLGARAARRSALLGAFRQTSLGFLRALVAHPHRSLAALGAALAVQAAYTSAWILLASGFGFDVPIALFLVFVPLVSFVSMAPITISGLGLREGAWAILLAPFAVSAADAIGYGFAYYLCGLVPGLIGAAVYARTGLAPDRSPAG